MRRTTRDSISRKDQTTISIHVDTAEKFRRIIEEQYGGIKSSATNRIVAWWCEQPTEVQMWILGLGNTSVQMMATVASILRQTADTLASPKRVVDIRKS